MIIYSKQATRDEPFIAKDNYMISDSNVTDYLLRNAMISQWYLCTHMDRERTFKVHDDVICTIRV